MCMCTYVYLSAVAWGGQKGPWDPLQLELQAIVSTERQNPFLWVSEEDGSRLSNTEGFFLMVKTLWSVLQTPYIFQNKTRGGGLTVYSSDFCVLLFIFSFIFCKLYSWRILSMYAMKYDHIRPSPSLPPTSLQPQSPHLLPNFLHSFKNIQCWPYVDGCEANPWSTGNSPQ